MDVALHLAPIFVHKHTEHGQQQFEPPILAGVFAITSLSPKWKPVLQSKTMKCSGKTRMRFQCGAFTTFATRVSRLAAQERYSPEASCQRFGACGGHDQRLGTGRAFSHRLSFRDDRQLHRRAIL